MAAVSGVLQGCSCWGCRVVHSPPPGDCAVPGHSSGTATAESRWHLSPVRASACLIPASLQPSITCWLVWGWRGGQASSQPSSLRHHMAISSAVAHGLAQSENHPLQSGSSSSSPCCVMLCHTISYRAVPCHVKLCPATLYRVVPCHTTPHHAMLCQVLLQAGREASRAVWQKGPDPAPSGEAPARAWAPAVRCCRGAAQLRG